MTSPSLFNVTNFFRSLTLVSFGIGVSQYTQDEKLRKAAKLHAELQAQLRELQEQKIELQIQEAKETVELKVVTEQTSQDLKTFNETVETVKELAADPSKHVDMEHNLDKALDAGQRARSSMDKVTEIVEKLSGKNNKFSLTDHIASIQDFFSSLSFYDHTAILNLLGCCIILFCLSTIILTLLSEHLIIKYNISAKFPRLGKFLLIRTKIQYFYLVLDFTIIIGVVFSLIYVNIIALT